MSGPRKTLADKLRDYHVHVEQSKKSFLCQNIINIYIYSMCGLSLTSINVGSFFFFFFFLDKSQVLENSISGEN